MRSKIKKELEALRKEVRNNKIFVKKLSDDFSKVNLCYVKIMSETLPLIAENQKLIIKELAELKENNELLK